MHNRQIPRWINQSLAKGKTVLATHLECGAQMRIGKLRGIKGQWQARTLAGQWVNLPDSVLFKIVP